MATTRHPKAAQATPPPLPNKTVKLLRILAERYETAEFVASDPVQFPRSVSGALNQETTAFVASALSYGSRTQFLPKIGFLVEAANGDLHSWIKSGAFSGMFCERDKDCFYRLYCKGTMAVFFNQLRRILLECGSLGEFVRTNSTDGFSAITALCKAFGNGCSNVVPKDAMSSCKRICMFLRWMVRCDSSVDIGLWSDWFDRRTLIIPLDVHVMRQAHKLGLLDSRAASMNAAKALTAKLAQVFPDDPLKGDFALYGLGISGE